MKKMLGFCVVICAALLCALPQSAQATGKIRAVHVNDPDGIYSFPNFSEPLKVGDKIHIRFHMVNLNWQMTQRSEDYPNEFTNPWIFTYTKLTGNETIDQQILMESKKPRLGLWISGGLREAECVNFPLGDASDWLTNELDNKRHYTDLVFEYTVQPGDLALPIQLANAAGTGPVDSSAPELVGYYLKYEGQETNWKMIDLRSGSVTNDFAFGPANLADDPDFAGDSLVGWNWASSFENRDLDLTRAGVYVQAVDFDSTYDDEVAGVWRTITQGSTMANPGMPTITIPGGSAKTMEFYLWTADTNIAEIVQGGQILSVTPYVFYDGVTRKVGKVRIFPGDESVPISIKATGSVGASTKVFLSASPTNMCNVAGDLVNDFITRTVQVGAPLPPDIHVTVNGKTMETVTANADYSTPLVGVNVTLSEAWAGPGALTVPIKVSVKEKPALNAHDYVGMSQSSMDDNTAWDTELTIPAGQTSAILSLWMYANRGTVDTENGLLVEVDANHMDAAARAFFMDNFIPATVVVNRSTPEITSELPALRGVEANMPNEITINVADAYGEMRPPCRYTVYWSNSGNDSAAYYTKITNLTASAAGDLSFSVTYTQKGDYTSKYYVVNEDGKASTKHTVAVTVTAQKVIEAQLVDGKSKFPEDAFYEETIVTLSFGDEGFTMPNGAWCGYVFLVPRDENSSNLVECLEFGIDNDHRWMTGYPVYEGDTSVGPFNMYLLDGSKMGVSMSYDIVVRTAENWNEGDIVTDWTSSGFSFSVTNVVPRVARVSMDDERLYVNYGTMSSHAFLSVSKTFTAQTTEPSDLDLHADQDNNYQDHTKAFTTKWTFDYGSGVPDVRYVYGPPSTQLSYVFMRPGTCWVTVRMRDKDMDYDLDEWGPEFTFRVEVDAKPSIALMPYNGQMSFGESATGQQHGRIDVNLSMMPSEEITVHLDVSRVGGDADNYPLPVLNSYDLNFGGSSGNTTNAYVYFDSLDGTSMGDFMGYVITATVTNTTLSVDGVAWKDLYRSYELPIYVYNEAPQILTEPAGTISKAMGEAFNIGFTVQDVPADLAAGLRMTWTTSEGISTNYQVAATGSGQYVTYSGYSPAFSFMSGGSKTVTLVVEDKDGGSSSRVRWDYLVITPPSGVTISNGGKTLIVDGTWITDTFGLPDSWVSEHPTAAHSLMTGEAANGRKVWECYVLGLDPEKTDNFKITSFPMNVDGTPDLAHLVFDPPQANWNVRDARPVVKGATSLDAGEWQTVTEENKATFRFFKICVELP